MPDDEVVPGHATSRPGSIPEGDRAASMPADQPSATEQDGAAPGASGGTGVGSRRGAFTGGIWSAASTVAPMAGTLVLSVVISRRLGADVLGEQSLVAYVASSLVSVLIYSFTAASVQLLASSVGAGDQARLAWLARWSYGAHLAGGVFSAGVLAGTGLVRGNFTSLWLLAAATALVDAVGWAHASRDIARRGWAPTSSRRLVAQAVAPLAGIVAVLAGTGVQGVFAAQLVVSVVLLAVLRRLDLRSGRLSRREHEAPAWRPVAGLWGLFALSGLIGQIVDRRLELVFLDAYDTASRVAMYSVAFSLVAIPTTLSGSLIHAAMPAIAARHAQDPGLVTGSFSRAARIVVTIDVLLCAGTVTLGPGLVRAAYGSEFGDAAVLVRWLGLTLLIVPLGQLYGLLWSGTGRLRPVLLAGGAAAVIDIALAWLLIPHLSTTGAVIATMSAQIVSAVVLMLFTWRDGIRLEARPRRLAGVLAIAVVAGAGAVLSGELVDGLPGDLLGIAVFGLLTATGARFVGLLEPDDLEWLAGTVPGPAGRALRVLSPTR